MKYLIKLILILTFNLISVISYCQTKKETQNWIKNKIELHAYTTGDEVSFSYDLKFDENNLIINDKNTFFKGNVLYCKAQIPIKKIAGLIFKENPDNFFMIIKTRGNKKSVKVHCKGDSDSYNELDYKNKFTLHLEKTIKNNNLKKRLKKAFNDLIVHYGGNTTKETY